MSELNRMIQDAAKHLDRYLQTLEQAADALELQGEARNLVVAFGQFTFGGKHVAASPTADGQGVLLRMTLSTDLMSDLSHSREALQTSAVLMLNTGMCIGRDPNGKSVLLTRWTSHEASSGADLVQLAGDLAALGTLLDAVPAGAIREALHSERKETA